MNKNRTHLAELAIELEVDVEELIDRLSKQRAFQEDQLSSETEIGVITYETLKEWYQKTFGAKGGGNNTVEIELNLGLAAEKVGLARQWVINTLNRKGYSVEHDDGFPITQEMLQVLLKEKEDIDQQNDKLRLESEEEPDELELKNEKPYDDDLEEGMDFGALSNLSGFRTSRRGNIKVRKEIIYQLFGEQVKRGNLFGRYEPKSRTLTLALDSLEGFSSTAFRPSNSYQGFFHIRGRDLTHDKNTDWHAIEVGLVPGNRVDEPPVAFKAGRAGGGGHFHVLVDSLDQLYLKGERPEEIPLYASFDDAELLLAISNGSLLTNSIPVMLRQSSFKDYYAFSPKGLTTLANPDKIPVELRLMKHIEGLFDRKYWIYAPGEVAHKWDEFWGQEIMGLGWDELGDLRDYPDKSSMAVAIGNLYGTKGSNRNSSLANYEFVHVMKPGDIVIAKKGKRSYLGYGVVKSNYYFVENEPYGSRRKVDWKTNGEWEETEHDIVSKTLTDITKYPEYVERLRGLLGIELPTHYNEQDSISNFTPQNFKATVANDEAFGEDQLGFEEDAKAFARLIALKDTNPPLSIAVFGEWGSGKSFFMHLIEKELQRKARIHESEETTGQEAQPYYNGIATITFNAWSYIDSNLWASLVTRIFEGLDEYLRDYKKGDDELRSIRDELSHNLEIARKEQDHLQRQIDELESKKQELQGKREEHERNKTTYKSKLAELSKAKLLETVLGSGQYATARKAFVDQYKKLSPEDGAGVNADLDPYTFQEVMADLQSFKGLARSFFANKKANTQAFMLVLALMAVPVGLHFLQVDLSAVAQIVVSGLSPLLVLAHRIQRTFTKMKPAIKASLKLGSEIQKGLDEAELQYANETRRLEEAIASCEMQIEQAHQQVSHKEAHIQQLQKQQKHGLGQQAVAAFIEKKAGGSDYSKYLGVISIIRKDFETLSNLFGENQTGLNQQDYLTKPLNRIVLFIDDLDRCPVEQVVEVLDAVKLLMCFDLFVVIVGVAPNWVRNSLLKKHYAQFGQMNRDVDSLTHVPPVNPLNYLEKIFQIPYHLRIPGAALREQYVRSLFDSIKAHPEPIEREEPDSTTSEPPSTEIHEQEKGVGVRGIRPNQSFIEDIRVETSDTQEGEETAIENDVQDQPVELSALNQEATLDMDFYRMTEEELNVVAKTSILVGSNPRTVKRFANLYRLLRVNAMIQQLWSTDKQGQLKTLVLLAILNGDCSEMAEPLDQAFGVDNMDKTLKDVLIQTKGDYPKNDIPNLANTLIWRSEEHTELERVFQILFTEFKDYHNLIRQYSFSVPVV